MLDILVVSSTVSRCCRSAESKRSKQGNALHIPLLAGDAELALKDMRDGGNSWTDSGKGGKRLKSSTWLIRWPPASGGEDEEDPDVSPDLVSTADFVRGRRSP